MRSYLAMGDFGQGKFLLEDLHILIFSMFEFCLVIDDILALSSHISKCWHLVDLRILPEHPRLCTYVLYMYF